LLLCRTREEGGARWREPTELLPSQGWLLPAPCSIGGDSRGVGVEVGGCRELGAAAGRRPWRSFSAASRAGEVEFASMEEEGQGTPWLAEGRSSCALEEEEGACAHRLKEKRGRDGCGGWKNDRGGSGKCPSEHPYI
jgi:hypothetical protein